MTAPDIVPMLKGVPLLQSLSDDELDRIAPLVTRERIEAATNIVEIGDPGHALYIVVSGEVDVVYPARSSDFTLARLGPGETFGEMAILNDMPRSATVRSTGPVELFVLEREAFSRVLVDTPSVALKLLEVLSLRIRNADAQLGGLNEKAMRDQLTGLLNRRAFHDRLNEECDRTRRYGEPFSLILIDLDKFKQINDTLGHDSGDLVLGWMGRLLTEHTRQADSAYRIGGEEFAVLCPSSEGEVAARAAERLVSIVAQAKPPLSAELTVTMSAGYASCPAIARTPDEIFQQADRALLRAKADGRNRVCGPPDAI